MSLCQVLHHKQVLSFKLFIKTFVIWPAVGGNCHLWWIQRNAWHWFCNIDFFNFISPILNDFQISWPLWEHYISSLQRFEFSGADCKKLKGAIGCNVMYRIFYKISLIEIDDMIFLTRFRSNNCWCHRPTIARVSSRTHMPNDASFFVFR